MISDLSTRQRALEPEQSFIVQAPAGSGKTALLVYRILVLLARVDRPEQILAITFTRKATAEMRQRLLELLQMAESQTNSEDPFEQQGIDLAKHVLLQDKKHGWKLLDAPHQLQILTIDAFCGKLAGHMPWLSRLGDRPRTTDLASKHYDAAIEQLLSELLNDSSPSSETLQQVLLELDFNYPRARRLFSAMLAKRDQWLRHLLQNDLANMRSELEQAWTDVRDQHFDKLHEMLPQSTHQTLISIGLKAAEYLEPKPNSEGDPKPKKVSPLTSLSQAYERSDAEIQNYEWLAIRHLLLTDAGTLRKSITKTTGFPTTDREHKDTMMALLAEFEGDTVFLNELQQVSSLPLNKFSESDWQQLLALEKVLKTLAAFLQLRFRSMGECDHSEVTQRANLALQELEQPTDLALRMDYQIKHILVDEFQDTSHSQLQLLRKLTAGWNVLDQLNTLFLVGDPMQSIYRFREADVSLFLQVSNNQQTKVFDTVQIEPLQLTENFRSTSQLVDWFNRVFSNSFPQQDQVLTGAISYARASSQKDMVSGTNSPANPVITQLASTKQNEAGLVIEQIRKFLDEYSDDKRVAVLVRSRNHLQELLPAFKQAAIDYSGVDIQPLREAQSVIDVLALCKAICRLDDRVSWLSLLRGPWCGLTLAEIKQIITDDSFSHNKLIWHCLDDCDPSYLNRHFNADTQGRLNRFITIMRQALEQRQQIGLHSIVRWSWQALGGEQTLFGTAIEDIYELFELIQGCQYGGDITSINELDKALEGLYARPINTQARVVVSTIHKAKGLQYHSVILPSLASQSRSQDKEILMWAERATGSAKSQLLLAPIRFTDDQGSHYGYLRQLEAQRSQNEIIRLMYVACTRAEQRLILIGLGKIDDKTESLKAPAKSSLLNTIWGETENNFQFTDARNDVAEEPDSNNLISQSLFRLPAEFEMQYEPSIEWQPKHQLQTKSQDDIADTEKETFEWATEVATAVGILMHEWLQFNQKKLFETNIDNEMLSRWRQELRFLGVENSHLDWAVKRLKNGFEVMQQDVNAQFVFANYPIENNEYALATYSGGAVRNSRIDRTFVDGDNVRWIIDYKTTFTQSDDVQGFVEEQVQQRHKEQLEKYADLMRKIDTRSIKLAVYFPMLGELYSWDYQG